MGSYSPLSNNNPDEPIYCNLIGEDNDFDLDSRLERLRVSASLPRSNNNNKSTTVNNQVGDHHQQTHHHHHHHQDPQHRQLHHQLDLHSHHQQSKQHQNLHQHQQHITLRSNLLRTIEEINIDHDLISPTKDLTDIGDNSYNSRQLEAQFSPNNLRFQSYKYLTQSWPESSAPKMLDSPLGRKVYHVAAEQTKTLSPVKEKCVKNYGRVKSWANSFDNLLNDPIGVKIYSRFLSREYSDENILFWMACEKYKKLIKKTEARKEAKAIYEQYLSINGSHTVNVDSQARNSVYKSLNKPSKELFDIPQTQVYNLMKNDSYKRFLTSELYEMCLESEKTGKPLPVVSKDDYDTKKVPSSSKRRLSLSSWVLKKTFRL